MILIYLTEEALPSMFCPCYS